MSRIAVIGAGISGLGAAYFLAGRHQVVLYEAERRLGGHARTLRIDRPGGPTDVDTGFIVYNEANYPLLTALFGRLGVETIPTDMSFGVSYDGGALEFCGSSLSGLFAQRANLFSPHYWAMLRDIQRFFGRAPGLLDAPGDPSLGEALLDMHLGSWMRDRFLVPMGAAIWSMPPGEILAMPAKSFVRFFANHNLLQAMGHRLWRTVAGGSSRYVAALASVLTETRGAEVRSGAPAVRIEPSSQGQHTVITRDGARDTFDEVVLACQADSALSLLADPTDAERAILGAFRYSDNDAVLHNDIRLMPKAKAAWASWVCLASGAGDAPGVSVSYWMNKLQSLPGPPLIITLNPRMEIPDDRVYDRHTFRHPVMSRAAVEAQARIPGIQGRRGLWFCGAWQRYGFHEDGLWSAAEIARLKGVALPWA